MRFAQLTLLSLSLASMTALAATSHLPMQGATATSATTYPLHFLIFWFCILSGSVIFGVMFYTTIKHRRQSTAKQVKHFHKNLWVELLWICAALLIIVLMLIPAANVITQKSKALANPAQIALDQQQNPTLSTR